jgi:hypothetical protein
MRLFVGVNREFVYFYVWNATGDKNNKWFSFFDERIERVKISI